MSAAARYVCSVDRRFEAVSSGDLEGALEEMTSSKAIAACSKLENGFIGAFVEYLELRRSADLRTRLRSVGGSRLIALAYLSMQRLTRSRALCIA